MIVVILYPYHSAASRNLLIGDRNVHAGIATAAFAPVSSAIRR